MTYPDICKGCKDYEEDGKSCSHAYVEGIYAPKELACPCSICLIKMMCSTACDLLMIHDNLLRNYERQQYENKRKIDTYV